MATPIFNTIDFSKEIAETRGRADRANLAAFQNLSNTFLTGRQQNINQARQLMSDFEAVTRRVSIDDFFGDRGYSTYRSLGYSEDFARLKVQENLIIYALARALKPTGRLNVDDIKRASDLVNLQGFTSPEYVRGQLKEILRFIRKAQVDLYGQGQIGDRNVFDQEYYGPMVETYKQFLGQTPPMSESPKIEPNIENPPAEDPTQQEVTYNGEIFTMGDNI